MYHKIHRFQDALQCFKKVLSKITDDKTVYIASGIVYQDMGNHQLAIADFNEAIKLDPELSEGYYRRGLSMLNSRNAYDAITDFEKAKDKEQMKLYEDPTAT